MEVLLLMPASLDKALLSKACTNPRMQALRGCRDLPSVWISSVSRRMEAMCSQVGYLRLITQRISARAGQAVLPLGTVQGAAASLPIRGEAVRYGLAMRWEW